MLAGSFHRCDEHEGTRAKSRLWSLMPRDHPHPMAAKSPGMGLGTTDALGRMMCVILWCVGWLKTSNNSASSSSAVPSTKMVHVWLST